MFTRNTLFILGLTASIGALAGQNVTTTQRRVPKKPAREATPARAEAASSKRTAEGTEPARATAARLDRYALILADPPVAKKLSSRTQLQSAPAVSRRQQVLAQQKMLRDALGMRNIHVISATQTLLNAVYVIAPGVDQATLRALPGVARVVRMQPIHRTLNVALGLENVSAAWSQVGGQQNAGKGVRIAVLDTGIDVLHPAFGDTSLSPPSNYPPSSGSKEDNWPAYTNKKIIVARSYVDELVGFGDSTYSRPDDLSPEDHVGHGTAAAMIAAGTTVNAPLAQITGVAPKAFLGNYKIYGSPGVNDITFPDVVFNAMEDAVNDGMDVVSLSLGSPAIWGPDDSGSTCGQQSGVFCDPFVDVVENAVSLGISVVTSAGNEANTGHLSPSYGTIASPGTAPSAITVGASYNAHIFYAAVQVPGTDVPSNLKVLNAFFSDALRAGGGFSAPATDVAPIGGSTNPDACYPLPANSLSGAIALVQQSQYCNFSLQALNIENAGAWGIIFYPYGNSDFIYGIRGLTEMGISSAMIGSTDAGNLKSFLANHPNHQVALDPSLVETQATGNYVAYFSSRGPATGTGGIKPELVAVGTDLYTATQSFDPNGDLFDASGYTVAEGTSFAVPMVAGVAAMVIQVNPNLTPSQVKSTVVNAASEKVYDYDSNGKQVLAGIEAVGSGILDAGAAVANTVTVEPSTISFGILSGTLASGTLTITNFSNSNANLSLSVDSFFADPNATLTLSSNSLTLSPGNSAKIQVALKGNPPTAGIYEGYVNIAGGNVPIHVPYLYVVGDGNAVDAYPLRGKDFADAAGNPLNGDLLLKVVDQYGAPVNGFPVRFNSSIGDSQITSGTGTIGTDPLGIAFATAKVGTTGFQELSADIGNPKLFTVYFDGRAFDPPSISAAGIVNGASFVQNQQGFAPGSYISFFGTGLSELSRLFYTSYLPLSLGNVSVSFDVPKQNISYPGNVVFISPGQVNVQVPWELAGQSSADVKISIGLTSSVVVNIPINSFGPGFFEYGDTAGATYLAAQDAAFHLIGTSNPAVQGSTILLYSNGLGPVNNTPASGWPTPQQAPVTTSTPQVTIGGKNASVVFSGLSPGSIGLYQINVVVPTGLGHGPQPVTMSIGGVAAKNSTIFVQ